MIKEIQEKGYVSTSLGPGFYIESYPFACGMVGLEGSPVSLVMTVRCNNELYMASDTRCSVLSNANDSQLSYDDNFQKMFPFITDRFLLGVAGNVEFGKTKKTPADIAQEINNSDWLKNNIDGPLENIAAYILEIFQKYVDERYQLDLDNAKDDSNIVPPQTFLTKIMVIGFNGIEPEIITGTIIPNDVDNDVYKFPRRIKFHSYSCDGVSNELDTIANQTDFKSMKTEDVVNLLLEYIEYGHQKSEKIGEKADIYKISLINGREKIEKLV